eukprot:4478279-Karenia_brevis.AAC.1
MHKSEHKRIEISCPQLLGDKKLPNPTILADVSPSHIVKLIMTDIMAQEDVILLQGSAPAGHLERDLQAWLDKHGQKD